MARRKERWKRPEPKVLATADSKRVVRCYAIQGKAYIFQPIHGEKGVTLILINSERETYYVDGCPRFGMTWACNLDRLGNWRVLGWIPPGGELRHGNLEDVDPELADLEKLPVPNNHAPVSHSTPASYYGKEAIDIVPWDADGKPEYDV